MDFACRTIRDISTMVGAAIKIIMLIIELIFYSMKKAKIKTSGLR